MKITDQKHGKLNEQDRLELARLLVKAGYTVSLGKEKTAGKTTNTFFIEAIGDSFE